MAAIFAFSATPESNLPNFGSFDTLIYKGSHMLGYALLTLTYFRGLKPASLTGRKAWKYVIFSLGMAMMYAATDEFHQLFVPGRGSRLTDVGIDTVGGMAGLFLYHIVPAIRWGTFFRLPVAVEKAK